MVHGNERYRKRMFELILIVITVILQKGLQGDKIESKIYKKFEHVQPCVLLTNATHQIGCTSQFSGNVGVLHFVKSKKDLKWLIEDGPHKPYIPLLTSEMFSEENMRKLISSKKIAGALVINAGKYSSRSSRGFSPDPECPLDDFGMYHKDKTFGNCKKIKWNKGGNAMSMEYYGVPIFALSEEGEVNEVIACFEKNNKPIGTNSAEYPLCGIELRDFMFAAKDTPTCRRKTETPNAISYSFCDPLGDYNVWGTLYPVTKPVKDGEIIMLSAKLDSSGFFHDLAPGADNDVTGIVTLLGAAYALGNLKRSYNKNSSKPIAALPPLKPIMFMLFNGEIWDYIGSSRMVWDMEKGDFPYKGSQAINASQVSKFNTSSIGYFIELSQVGLLDDGALWIHSDPISQKNTAVKQKIEQLSHYIQDAASKSGLKIKNVTSGNPLPPASLQRFLKSNKNIPGIVLTDHKGEFTNKFYNSRFDNPLNINITAWAVNNSYTSMYKDTAERIAKLSQSLATTVYRLASDGKNLTVDLKVPTNLIANLLYCFLYSAKCPSFTEVLPRKAHDDLPTQPYSRYISVAQIENPITNIVYNLLAYYSGNWTDPDKEPFCPETKTQLPEAIFSTALKGPIRNDPSNPRKKGPVCVHYTTYKTDAFSPAFETKDYNSKEFSTWAESMWTSDFGVRMFLIAGSDYEGAIFGSGIAILIISFVVVYFVFKNADIIFTPTNIHPIISDAPSTS